MAVFTTIMDSSNIFHKFFDKALLKIIFYEFIIVYIFSIKEINKNAFFIFYLTVLFLNS
jgi:hypothetical protein